MPLEVLTGHDVPSLLARAQRSLGEDAVVLAVQRIREGSQTLFEMTVADARTAEQQRRLEHASRRGAEAVLAADRPGQSYPLARRAPLHPSRPSQAPIGYVDPRPRQTAAAIASMSAPARASRGPLSSMWPVGGARVGDRRPRPTVIALVGPTGAGKTTTLPKLTHNIAAFAGRSVGFLNLDTFRVGAVEQTKHWAELARVPSETVWERSEIARALRRLRDREVVLVDTPGRGPRAASDLSEVHARLLEIVPDEVHLVVPAGMQSAVVRRTFTNYLPLGVTHVLATKLDECPEERAVFEAATQFGLPMRWLADGQEVPADLQPAPAANFEDPLRMVLA